MGTSPRAGWLKVGVIGMLAVLAVAGCARFRGSGEPPETISVAADEDHEAALRRHIRTMIAEGSRSTQDPQAELVQARPYFYREYVAYPEGPDRFEVNVRATNSRTTPYAAEVRIPILRYATRMRRDRHEAETDTNFMRSRGTQTLSYQFKHRNWVHVGSLFVAEQVEEQVDGQWVPLREDVLRALTEEPRDGFFGRMWSSIFGR